MEVEPWSFRIFRRPSFLPPSPWKIRRPWCLRGFSAHSRPFLVSCLMCMVVRLSCHPGSYNLYMILLFRFSTLLTRPHVSSMPFLFPYHTSLINSNSAVIPFFVLPLRPPFFSSVHRSRLTDGIHPFRLTPIAPLVQKNRAQSKDGRKSS